MWKDSALIPVGSTEDLLHRRVEPGARGSTEFPSLQSTAVGRSVAGSPTGSPAKARTLTALAVSTNAGADSDSNLRIDDQCRGPAHPRSQPDMIGSSGIRVLRTARAFLLTAGWAVA